MDELREKMAGILAQFGIGNIFEQDAIDQILALIKEAGYVQIKAGDLYFSKEQRARGDITEGYYKQ